MKLSVILSLYEKNSPALLQESLDSIINQTRKADEIVLVENGPLTEELYTIVGDFINKAQNVKVIKFNENHVFATALNAAIQICGGDYIARMDTDDISLEYRFEEQLCYMEAHPEVDCLGTWAYEIGAKGELFYKKKMPVSHEECYEFFKKRDCFIHPTVMFRRSYFEKAGLYPEDTYFGEDTVMWAQGFANGCIFANLPSFVFKYRLDDDFFNRRRGWKHAKSILQLRWRVNKMLHYPLVTYFYALGYAMAKLMPEFVLSIIYKKAR
jgi:glycosyltransferase involved in cell wall biosynthesis